MLYRNKKENDMHQGMYVGLGGKLEAGESPEECAIREVWEESGLVVENPQLKGVLTFPAFSKDEDWYVFLFVITKFTGELKPCTEGELVWVDKDELNGLPMHEGDYLFIKRMQEYEGVFSAKFEYEGTKLKGYSMNLH